MKRLFLILCPLALSGALTSCAPVENALRAQPSAFIGTGFATDNTSGAGLIRTELFGGNVHVFCVEDDGDTQALVPLNEGDAFNPSMFVTVDISQLLKTLSDAKSGSVTITESATDLSKRRDDIVKFLIYISDHNCNLYLNRIFALNKTRHAIVGLGKNMVTAGTAGTAFISPPIAAGLGLFNLLGGALSDQIDQNFYSSDTFEALEAVISSTRLAQKKVILDALSANPVDDTTGKSKYAIMDALNDIQAYDAMASFRGALQAIQDKATADKVNTQGAMDAAKTDGNDGTKTVPATPTKPTTTPKAKASS
jgi:hypothetical protein